MKNEKLNILIIRNFANEVNLNSYNLQEVGMAKALVKKGHSCDIVYYTHNKKMIKQTISVENSKINIYWCPAIKFMSNAIYVSLIKKRFFESYDVIQTSEYNQIMTYILCKLTTKPVVLYHGPYNDNKKDYINKIYDKLFLKFINKNISAVISKSYLATKYLKIKNFKKIHTLGVGLDTSNFNQVNTSTIQQIKDSLKDNKVILYVGRLDDNKNIKFMIDTLERVVKVNKSIKLVLVGRGENEKVKEYMEYASEKNILKYIMHINGLSQNELPSIYNLSDIFILPSKSEIFGMVILESMYFSTPVISSLNGGSSVVIDNGINGFVIENFDSQLWSNKIVELFNNQNDLKNLKYNANKSVKRFTWDVLIDKYIEVYKSILD